MVRIAWRRMSWARCAVDPRSIAGFRRRWSPPTAVFGRDVVVVTGASFSCHDVNRTPLPSGAARRLAVAALVTECRESVSRVTALTIRAGGIRHPVK